MSSVTTIRIPLTHISLKNHPKTGECEIRIVVRDRFRFADDHRSQTPGRHHRRHRSDLLDNPINEAIDLSRKSEDGT
jgi:hypothetical protein